MNNIQPWCVSRQLWWGHRIPAWFGPDKKIFVDDGYYIGIRLFLSEVESGFHTPTGSAKIEEDGSGFSLIAGMKVFETWLEV